MGEFSGCEINVVRESFFRYFVHNFTMYILLIISCHQNVIIYQQCPPPLPSGGCSAGLTTKLLKRAQHDFWTNDDLCSCDANYEHKFESIIDSLRLYSNVAFAFVIGIVGKVFHKHQKSRLSQRGRDCYRRKGAKMGLISTPALLLFLCVVHVSAFTSPHSDFRLRSTLSGSSLQGQRRRDDAGLSRIQSRQQLSLRMDLFHHASKLVGSHHHHPANHAMHHTLGKDLSKLFLKQIEASHHPAAVR